MPSMLPVYESFTPCGAFPCLKQGDSGPEVEYLQRQLQSAGFDAGAVDGCFNARTKAALMAFQRSKGLEVNGVAGPRTWSALDVQRGSGQRPVLKRGVSDLSVQVIQKMLAAHGFEPGPKDGIFGAKTERAVMAFQRTKGLEADGIVGPKTWGALSSPVTPRTYSGAPKMGMSLVLTATLPEGAVTFSI